MDSPSYRKLHNETENLNSRMLYAFQTSRHAVLPIADQNICYTTPNTCTIVLTPTIFSVNYCALRIPQWLAKLPDLVKRGYWSKQAVDYQGYPTQIFHGEESCVASYHISFPRSYEIGAFLEHIIENGNRIQVNGGRQQQRVEAKLADILWQHTIHTNRQLHAADKVWQTNRPQLQLTEHQMSLVRQGILLDGQCNFSDMGTGKTVTTILTIFNKWLIAGRPDLPVLIICPKSLRLGWKRQFEIFTRDHATGEMQVSATIISGNVQSRKYKFVKALQGLWQCDEPPEPHGTFRNPTRHITQQKLSIIICNYNTVTDDIAMFESCDRYFAIAIDECHNIKHYDTKRCKSIFMLQHKTKHRYSLTGTPQANKFSDVYNLIEWVYPDYFNVRYTTRKDKQDVFGHASLAVGHKKFESEYAQLDYFKGVKGVKKHKAIELSNAIDYCSVRLKKEDVIKDLPEQYEEDIFVELSEKVNPLTGHSQKSAYNDMNKRLLIKAKEMLGGDGGINGKLTANNILVKYLRLEQITSGYVCWDVENTVDCGELGTVKYDVHLAEYFPENPKLEALKKLVYECIEDNKCIIWFHFIKDLKLITEWLKADNIPYVQMYGQTNDRMRQESIATFNSDAKVRVLVNNITEGLNLLGYDQHSDDIDMDNLVMTNTNIFYSKSWSLTNFEQAKDRSYRHGTRVPQFVYNLQVKGTIDEVIQSAVKGKKLSSDIIIDRLFHLL